MQKFIEQKRIIEAIQYTGDNWKELNEAGVALKPKEGNSVTMQVYNHLTNRYIDLDIGDWLIRTFDGDFYPMKAEDFIEAYKPKGE